MIKKFISCMVAATVCGAVSVVAQQSAPDSPAGTLKLEKKTYPLKHVIAYETTFDEEDAIAVVLSGPKISAEKLKEAREAEKDGRDGDFDKPFVQLVFKKTGELRYWGARAGGTSLGRQSGSATGTLKRQDGRAVGQASQPFEAGGFFPTGFDARFDVPLLKAGESLPASPAKKYGPAAKVKGTVTGLFKGNGKEAKLTYVSAHWGEPFADKAGIELIFTEKDQSKEKKPEMSALFGRLGSALIISLHEDGQIYGCQVVHSAHQKQGFSSIGNLEAIEFNYEDGKVEGELTTSGQVETFGETWEVNIKFVAPLGEIPKEFQVAEATKPDKQTTTESKTGSEDAGEDAATSTKPPAAELKAKDLALPKDASDVDYQSLVEQIAFKSKSNVKSVCAALAANLKAQGWAVDGLDMVNPQSSILRRKRGEASLTIFVKPLDGGSEVKMMTEGLSWDGE
ncbi:MAG: hypothetical protein ABIU29_12535 [Chthoniobacterales bacterium]